MILWRKRGEVLNLHLSMGGARARVYGRIQMRSRLHSAGHHLEECVQESRSSSCTECWKVGKRNTFCVSKLWMNTVTVI